MNLHQYTSILDLAFQMGRARHASVCRDMDGNTVSRILPEAIKAVRLAIIKNTGSTVEVTKHFVTNVGEELYTAHRHSEEQKYWKTKKRFMVLEFSRLLPGGKKFSEYVTFVAEYNSIKFYSIGSYMQNTKKETATDNVEYEGYPVEETRRRVQGDADKVTSMIDYNNNIVLKYSVYFTRPGKDTDWNVTDVHIGETSVFAKPDKSALSNTIGDKDAVDAKILEEHKEELFFSEITDFKTIDDKKYYDALEYLAKHNNISKEQMSIHYTNDYIAHMVDEDGNVYTIYYDYTEDKIVLKQFDVSVKDDYKDLLVKGGHYYVIDSISGTDENGDDTVVIGDHIVDVSHTMYSESLMNTLDNIQRAIVKSPGKALDKYKGMMSKVKTILKNIKKAKVEEEREEILNQEYIPMLDQFLKQLAVGGTLTALGFSGVIMPLVAVLGVVGSILFGAKMDKAKRKRAVEKLNDELDILDELIADARAEARNEDKIRYIKIKKALKRRINEIYKS